MSSSVFNTLEFSSRSSVFESIELQWTSYWNVVIILKADTFMKTPSKYKLTALKQVRFERTAVHLATNMWNFALCQTQSCKQNSLVYLPFCASALVSFAPTSGRPLLYLCFLYKKLQRMAYRNYRPAVKISTKDTVGIYSKPQCRGG